MADGELSKTSKPSFRPDIEGLRAIAVLLVLLFHASIPGFNGGFVGVDVFFVISGFLITGMLLREYEATGKISLGNFYARRVRRLLPASALVLVVTLVASAILLPPLSVPSVATDVAAATLYVSNMVFAYRATDYFAAGSAPSPILHFWSLGVEEQFYLLWPAIFLLAMYGARRFRVRIGLAMAIIGFASFTFATYLVTRHGPWAFFSLPTRAWELALGGMLAAIGIQLSRIPQFVSFFLGWVGLGAVIWSGVFTKVTSPFPSWPALIPTIGAALLIVAGSRASKFTPTRLLSGSIFQFLGRISYSLYLWHWPLLILPMAIDGGPLNIYERSGLALAAVPFAYATHRWVEDPLRRGKFVGTLPRKNLLTAAAMAVVIAAASFGTAYGFTVTEHHKIKASTPEEKLAQVEALLTPLAETKKSSSLRPHSIDHPVPANLEPQLINAKNDRAISYADRCHTEENLPPSKAPCIYGDTSSTTTVVLFGDSHALSWFPAMNTVAKRNHWRLLSLTMSACSPADIPAWDPSNNAVMKNCAIWRTQSLQKIAQAQPLVIVVAGTRGFATLNSKGKLVKGDPRTAIWRAGMKRTVDQLKAASKYVVYLADTPNSLLDPPVCLSAHPKSSLACATPVDRAIQNDWIEQELAMTNEESILFIDPELWVCPTSPCPVILGNILIYLDGGHLTATFSAALAGRLQKAISKATGIPLPAPTPSTSPSPKATTTP